MFNRDQALAEWLRKMRRAGIKDQAALDELESHLRDEIEAQLQLGLDEGQAFEAAVHRIGEGGILSPEYAKVHPQLGNHLLLGFATLYFAVAGGSALFRLGSFSDINSTQQISGVAAAVITVMLICSGRLLIRISPVISDQRVRVAIHGLGVLSVFIWLAVFYHYVMTHAEWDLSQLLTALLWAWVPMGALCGMIFGMESAAKRAQQSHV